VFSYAISTTTDPVAPGQVAQFTVMVTNLTNATQSAVLSYRIPRFTSSAGFSAGHVFNINFSNVSAGGSQSVLVNLNVLSGGQAPPDGTIINLVVNDAARAGAVSRSIVVQ
jgi:hypothetical protein